MDRDTFQQENLLFEKKIALEERRLNCRFWRDVHGVGPYVAVNRTSTVGSSAFTAGRSLMLDPFGPHRYKFATALCSLQLLTKQFSSIRRSAPETGAKIAIAS